MTGRDCSSYSAQFLTLGQLYLSLRRSCEAATLSNYLVAYEQGVPINPELYALTSASTHLQSAFDALARFGHVTAKLKRR